MKKICIVSSCGGHLTEVRVLKAAYDRFDYFYVLNGEAKLPLDMIGKTYFISHSERDWKFLLNLWEAFLILKRKRPHIILSTGAGPVVPFAIVGRLFFGTYIVFVETITRVYKPSMTGRIMYYLSHKFFYQWHELAPYFRKGECGGPIL